jgi:hypothetical protein
MRPNGRLGRLGRVRLLKGAPIAAIPSEDAVVEKATSYCK